MKKYIEKNFKKTEIGNIPQDWELKEIGQIFEIKAGGDLSKISFSKIKDEKFIYPVYSNSLRNKGIYGFSKDFQYEENAITITARGEVGKAEFRNHKFNAIIRLLVLKPKNKIKINCYFVSNFINSRLKFYSVGTSQNQLTIPMLSKRIIALPPLQEQKNIAKILGDFDAKIELNNRENEILEEMGKAIFKHWFVDFQYENYKKQGGKMRWNENLKKEIPKDWEVGKILEYVKIKQGKYIKRQEISDSIKDDKKYPIYGANGIRGYIKSYMYENSKVVFGCRGVCGQPKFSEKNSSITNTCMVIENEKSIFSSEFLYLWAQNVNFDFYTTGSVQPQITMQNLSKLKILIPPQNILEVFNKKTKPFFEKILENKKENEILRNLRDTLLPKLIKGEIRLK